MATTPITPDSGVEFNDVGLSVHNGQGSGFCDWSHDVVPVPSQAQAQTQLHTMRLPSEYDFGTSTGTDVDVNMDMDMDLTLDTSRALCHAQDQ
jgi:hypothetical protein